MINSHVVTIQVFTVQIGITHTIIARALNEKHMVASLMKQKRDFEVTKK